MKFCVLVLELNLPQNFCLELDFPKIIKLRLGYPKRCKFIKKQKLEIFTKPILFSIYIKESKNKRIDILNQPASICNIFNDEAEDTLDFVLLIDECDLENSNFGIDQGSKFEEAS